MPVDVLVPPLGTNVDTLTLISWYKQEGDAVEKAELLFAVQTDKAALDVESPASGILCGVSAKPGDEIAALSRIATIRGQGEAPVQMGNGQQTEPNAVAMSATIASHDKPVVAASRQHNGRIFISPRARLLAEHSRIDWQSLRGTGPEGAIVERDILAVGPAPRPRTASPVAQRMAEQAGLDWTQMAGSGPDGKVVREDVELATSTSARSARENELPGSANQAAPGTVSRSDQPSPHHIITSSPHRPKASPADTVLETLPLAGTRGLIAARMMQSAATTAPVTLTTEADATGLVGLRAQLSADGLVVSYNALFMRILARALKDHPRLNASLDGDQIKVWRSVNIGLAVDSESGLRAPVVRDVDLKGLQEIETEIQRVVDAARQGATPPEEMRGGTFTLTNLGMYGIDAFTPLINAPECGILGVGRIKPQPALEGEKLVTRQMVWLSLTFDHRLIDGAPAARFLQRVSQLVEKPHLLLG